MKTIDLHSEHVDLADVMRLAEHEPVLLLSEGKEFVIGPADDFEAEVETLRNSAAFHAFLDQRRKSGSRVTLEELERRIRHAEATGVTGLAGKFQNDDSLTEICDDIYRQRDADQPQ